MILKDYIKINPNFPILQKTKVCLDCKKENLFFCMIIEMTLKN